MIGELVRRLDLLDLELLNLLEGDGRISYSEAAGKEPADTLSRGG